MPTLPDFNCYEALGVEKDTSEQELKDSYRRLALVHHPDKNPENREEATARFQKISVAYETLRDSRSRARHDARHYPSSSSSRSSGSFPGFAGFGSSFAYADDDEEGYYYEEEADIEEYLRHQFFFEQFFGGGRRGYGGGVFFETGPDPREEYAAFARQVAEEEEQKRQKKIERDRKKVERDRAEKEEVERVWKESAAATREEKQANCPHLGFFVKEKQKRKLDCKPCGQKRGMVGFKCSHCSMLFCQSCLASLRKSRNE